MSEIDNYLSRVVNCSVVEGSQVWQDILRWLTEHHVTANPKVIGYRAHIYLLENNLEPIYIYGLNFDMYLLTKYFMFTDLPLDPLRQKVEICTGVTCPQFSSWFASDDLWRTLELFQKYYHVPVDIEEANGLLPAEIAELREIASRFKICGSRNFDSVYWQEWAIFRELYEEKPSRYCSIL